MGFDHQGGPALSDHLLDSADVTTALDAVVTALTTGGARPEVTFLGK
jgi:hypothetical protein